MKNEFRSRQHNGRQRTRHHPPIFGAWTEPDIIAQWMETQGGDARVDTYDFRDPAAFFRFVLEGGES